jgi:hypothetical protein
MRRIYEVVVFLALVANFCLPEHRGAAIATGLTAAAFWVLHYGAEVGERRDRDIDERIEREPQTIYSTGDRP